MAEPVAAVPLTDARGLLLDGGVEEDLLEQDELDFVLEAPDALVGGGQGDAGQTYLQVVHGQGLDETQEFG